MADITRGTCIIGHQQLSRSGDGDPAFGQFPQHCCRLRNLLWRSDPLQSASFVFKSNTAQQPPQIPRETKKHFRESGIRSVGSSLSGECAISSSVANPNDFLLGPGPPSLFGVSPSLRIQREYPRPLPSTRSKSSDGYPRLAACLLGASLDPERYHGWCSILVEGILEEIQKFEIAPLHAESVSCLCGMANTRKSGSQPSSDDLPPVSFWSDNCPNFSGAADGFSLCPCFGLCASTVIFSLCLNDRVERLLHDDSAEASSPSRSASVRYAAHRRFSLSCARSQDDFAWRLCGFLYLSCVWISDTPVSLSPFLASLRKHKDLNFGRRYPIPAQMTAEFQEHMLDLWEYLDFQLAVPPSEFLHQLLFRCGALGVISDKPKDAVI